MTLNEFLAAHPFDPCFTSRIGGELYYLTHRDLAEFERGYGDDFPAVPAL